MRLSSIGVVAAIAISGLLTACEEAPPPLPESVRPIRTFTVTEVASGKVRKFSGVIEASDSSSLSFQIGGNVRDVQVNQGDRVTKGQVLAVLDQEPFELDVQAAEADLQQARAAVAQKKAEFDRQKTLYQQGWVARVRFENAQRDYQSTSSRVDFAVARLNLARRNVRNATLAAPFDGFISLRNVDPFVEVQAGQTLFQLDAEGGFKAAFGIPETAVSQVVLGMPASVTLPLLAQPLDALITEIGSAAGAGNTFPVSAALIDPPTGVRAGMTAQVSLLLGGDVEQSGYLVPLMAVAPGARADEGFVFVYDQATSTVRRTLVESVQTMASNMVAVKGVNAGDIVATAGVNFLVDGQKVKLMEPAPTELDG